MEFLSIALPFAALVFLTIIVGGLMNYYMDQRGFAFNPHLTYLFIPAIVGALYFVGGFSMWTVKGIVLALILLYASLQDLSTHEADDFLWVMLVILSLVNFGDVGIGSMIFGAVAVFVPQMAMTEKDCLSYCYDKGFDWGGLYEIFHRVSCWCCPLQALSELRKLYEHFPDLWAQLRRWDDNTWRQFRADYSVRELEIRFAFGELLALEWSDIDFTKAELSVTKTCYDGQDEKGKSCRITIFMSLDDLVYEHETDFDGVPYKKFLFSDICKVDTRITNTFCNVPHSIKCFLKAKIKNRSI